MLEGSGFPGVFLAETLVFYLRTCKETFPGAQFIKSLDINFKEELKCSRFNAKHLGVSAKDGPTFQRYCRLQPFSFKVLMSLSLGAVYLLFKPQQKEQGMT